MRGAVDLGARRCRRRPGMIECSRSRTASESGRLMRTTTSAPPRRTRAAAFSTSVRALLLLRAAARCPRDRAGCTSAPRVCALSTYFSTLTGTYMSERQTGRSRCIVDSAGNSRSLAAYGLLIARGRTGYGADTVESRRGPVPLRAAAFGDCRGRTRRRAARCDLPRDSRFQEGRELDGTRFSLMRLEIAETDSAANAMPLWLCSAWPTERTPASVGHLAHRVAELLRALHLREQARRREAVLGQPRRVGSR